MKSINRILSEPLSAWLVKTNLHPNSITIMSGASGLIAFLMFIMGNTPSFILGALFFELFYVLDNCDGEVARAKGLSSHFGSWLDTLVDYVVHVIAFGGIMLGLYRQHENPVIFIAGIAAMIGIFLSFFVVILQKVKKYGLRSMGCRKHLKVRKRKSARLII
jgi:phosphatidylglycerophosphate synthase